MTIHNIYADYINGNDTTGNGSSGSPFKSPEKASELSAISPSSGDTINIYIRNGNVLLEDYGSTKAKQRIRLNSTKYSGINLVVQPDSGEPDFLLGGTDHCIQSLLGTTSTQVPASITINNASSRNDFAAGKPFLIFLQGNTNADIDMIFNNCTVNWSSENRSNRFIVWSVSLKMLGDISINNASVTYLASWAAFSGGFSGTITTSGSCDFGTKSNYGTGLSPTLYGGLSAGVTVEIGNISDSVYYSGETVSALISCTPIVSSGTRKINISGTFRVTDSNSSLIDLANELSATGSGTLQVDFSGSDIEWYSNFQIARFGAMGDTEIAANLMPRKNKKDNSTQRMKNPIGDNFRLINPRTTGGAGILSTSPQCVPHGISESLSNFYWYTPNTEGHTTSISSDGINIEGDNEIIGGTIALLVYGDNFTILENSTLELTGKTPVYFARSGGSNWESSQGFTNNGHLIINHTLTKEEFDASDSDTDLNRAGFTDRGGLGNPSTTFQDYIDGGEQATDRPDAYGSECKQGDGINAPEAGPTYSDVGPLGLNWKVGQVTVNKQHADIPAFRFGRPTGASTHEYIETSDVSLMRDFSQGTGVYSSQSAWFYNDVNAFFGVTVGVSTDTISKIYYGGYAIAFSGNSFVTKAKASNQVYQTLYLGSVPISVITENGTSYLVTIFESQAEELQENVIGGAPLLSGRIGSNWFTVIKPSGTPDSTVEYFYKGNLLIAKRFGTKTYM